MTTAPVSLTNALATVLRGGVNALIQGGEEALAAYITALDPAILALPPVQYIINAVLEDLSGDVAEAIGNGVVGIVIDIQTNGEQSTVVTAASALKYALAGSDQNAISKAQSDLISAWANVFHWNGTST